MNIAHSLVAFIKGKLCPKEDEYDPVYDDAKLTLQNLINVTKSQDTPDSYYQFLSLWDEHLYIPDKNDQNLLK